MVETDPKGIPTEIEIPETEKVLGIQVVPLQDDGAATKTEQLIKDGYKLFKVLIRQSASTKFPTTFHVIVGIFVKR